MQKLRVLLLALLPLSGIAKELNEGMVECFFIRNGSPADLVVKSPGYHNRLPIPGKDEDTYGNKIDIALKLVSQNCIAHLRVKCY